MSRLPGGFTLLEVLVALAVIALALVAVVRTAGMGSAALAHQTDTTYATWVAANVVFDVREAGGSPALGRSEGSMRMGPRDWYWRVDVETTEDPALRRLDVTVFADPQRESPIAVLTGFAGR
jgi:general secretion pathway protein I